MPEYSEITYAAREAIATITLNRPRARNGYTTTMAEELAQAFEAADADDTIRVVVFTGAGDDFCVGGDLSDGSLDLDQIDERDGFWKEPAGRCSMRIFNSRKPVIAAIDGAAVGAGSTICLPCDYRLASTRARFGFVFARRGMFPEAASTWFLPRLVGMGTALDWMVSGRTFDAQEAHAAGLVHRLYEPDELLERAYELAEELATRVAPVSAAVIRQMLYRMSPLDSPAPAQRLDSRLTENLPNNSDAIEGIMAFLQKREPNFTHTVPRDLPDYLPWQQE